MYTVISEVGKSNAQQAISGCSLPEDLARVNQTFILHTLYNGQGSSKPHY